MTPAVECSELVVRFGDVTAVDHASFRVDNGQLFAFLGPNGAGKSSTISVLCTLRPPSDGSARVAGFDTWKEAAEVRARIGVLFQDPTLDDRLTGKENLKLHASIYGVPRAERAQRIDEAMQLTGLGAALERQTRTYSGGMKRRLELARVLVHRPSVLFLDEPTAGLDPQTRRQLWQHLTALREEGGMTLFLTTHYLEEAEQADRVAIIDHGRMVAAGSPRELKQQLKPDIEDPTLEDVFVSLTGHDIRGGNAESRDMLRTAMQRRKRV